MIVKTEDRCTADAVLAIFNSYNCTDGTELLLYQYDNGREHGYVLELQSIAEEHWISYNDSIWVAFSEFRRSDDIVIYTDERQWSGRLTDKSYEECKMFKYNQIYEAAQYILNLFTSHVNALKAQRNLQELTHGTKS